MKAKYKRAITLHIAHGGILPCSEQKFQPFYYISFPLKVTSNNRRVPYADRCTQAEKNTATNYRLTKKKKEYANAKKQECSSPSHNRPFASTHLFFCHHSAYS